MKLGPGTLKIGQTGTEVDASCLVNNAKITHEKEEGDSSTKLCGDIVPGSVTYTYTLEGNVDIDPEDASGLFVLCDTSAGTQQPFVFVPNTAGGIEASGTLVVDPLDFGGDEYGEDMTSDIAFTIVGKPTFGAVVPLDTAGADDTAAAGDDVLVGV